MNENIEAVLYLGLRVRAFDEPPIFRSRPIAAPGRSAIYRIDVSVY